MAETVALRALAFLAADSRRLDGFCRVTGTPPDADALRALASTREGLVAVLDYLMTDEPMLLAFTGETGLRDTEPATALVALAGTDAREAGW